MKVYNCNFITRSLGGPGTNTLSVEAINDVFWFKSPSSKYYKKGVWVYACVDPECDDIPYGFISNESL